MSRQPASSTFATRLNSSRIDLFVCLKRQSSGDDIILLNPRQHKRYAALSKLKLFSPHARLGSRDYRPSGEKPPDLSRMLKWNDPLGLGEWLFQAEPLQMIWNAVIEQSSGSERCVDQAGM